MEYKSISTKLLQQIISLNHQLFLIDGQFGKKAVGYFGSIVRSAPVQFIFPE